MTNPNFLKKFYATNTGTKTSVNYKFLCLHLLSFIYAFVRFVKVSRINIYTFSNVSIYNLSFGV